MLVGISFLSAPVYFIKTRSKKCLVAMLFFFLFICLFGVMTFGGEYIANLVAGLWHEQA